MLSALYDAAQRGVEVQVVVDGIPYFKSMKSEADFFALGTHENVTIKVYNPIHLLKPTKLMARLHDKYLIVDDSSYILGGRNTYDYFLGDETNYKNYDWDILVTAEEGKTPESLPQLENYFETIWNLKDCKTVMEQPKAIGITSQKIKESETKLCKLYQKMQTEEWFNKDEEKEMIEVNQISLLSNPIQTAVKEPVLFYQMTELMRQTEGNITFHTPYILANSYMLERLSEICKSGNKVTMMTNSVVNNGNPFGAADYEIHKPDVLDTGVQILEYDQGVSYHGKCFTAGKELLGIGSFNWDMRSAYLDTELMLVVDSPELNQQMSESMQEYQEEALRVKDASSYELKEGQKPRTISKKRERRKDLLKIIDGTFRYLF